MIFSSSPAFLPPPDWETTGSERGRGQRPPEPPAAPGARRPRREGQRPPGSRCPGSGRSGGGSWKDRAVLLVPNPRRCPGGRSDGPGRGGGGGAVPGAVKAEGVVGAEAVPGHHGRDVGDGGAADEQLRQERQRRHQPWEGMDVTVPGHPGTAGALRAGRAGGGHLPGQDVGNSLPGALQPAAPLLREKRREPGLEGRPQPGGRGEPRIPGKTGCPGWPCCSQGPCVARAIPRCARAGHGPAALPGAGLAPRGRCGATRTRKQRP